MTVATGSMLGPYEVLGFVGAGGMGEVYRARDTRLHRDVAIKILRADRRASEGARQRLLQEARTASALTHPNIATVHDVVSVDAIDFIVMEYVTGKTLSALVRAGMTMDQAIRIAIPVADALGRAHQAGIVHRDLKPANVMVTADGTVKILDFGLATLAEERRPGSDLETASEDSASDHLARPGWSGGTPGYMSPEQAAGGTVDARSDIFSFGSLLYESVTGQRAFKGRSPAETMTKVVFEQPAAPSALVPDVPMELERLILRCLRKEPERRYQHFADIKVELQDIREERLAAAARAPRRHRQRRRLRGWRSLVVATAGAGVLGLAAFTRLVWRPADPTPPPSRVAPLTALPDIEASPTFSPDGTQVAYSWDGERRTDGAPRNFDLWLKLVGGSEARRLTDDSMDDMGPSWSPDGRYIAFHRGRPGRPATIHLVSPLGGVSRKLSDLPAAETETSWLRGAAVSQLSWSLDGRWLAVARARLPNESAPGAGGIHLLPAHGGDPRILTTPPSPRQDRDPAFSPDGGRLAYASCGSGTFAACELRVLDLDADFRARSPARSLASQELTILGIAWTRDARSLVYGGARVNLAHLWRVDADGARPPERIEAARQGISPATARGADRLAFSQSRVDNDIHAFEAGRPDVVVASSTLWDYGPSFSPDGRRIAFESGRSGDVEEIWIADADGANPRQLTHGPGGWQGSPSWSPDGRRIAFDSRGSDGFADAWTIEVDGTGLRRLTWGPLDDVLPSWSRDGRWIYYQQERPDGLDIWRVPADGGAAARVTHGGGFRALESFDGKLLLFVRRDDESPLFAQAAVGGPARRIAECVLSRSVAVGPDGVYYVGCPAEVPEGTLYRLDVESGVSTSLGTIRIGGGFVPGMAVSPDGKRVLFSKQVGNGGDLMMIDHFR